MRLEHIQSTCIVCGHDFFFINLKPRKICIDCLTRLKCNILDLEKGIVESQNTIITLTQLVNSNVEEEEKIK